MLSFLGSHPIRSKTAHRDTITGDGGRGSLAFYPSIDPRLMRATIPPHQNPPSIFEPPLHFHPRQTETFTILSGNMRALRGSQWTTVGAAGSVTIPAGVLHRFENASATDSLVFDVRLDPPLPSDEAFFRNAYSYAEDCAAAGRKPSQFQAALFLVAGETVPGVPYLPVWLSGPVMRATVWFVGVFIGEWILGYKRSYREYYDDKGD